MTDEPRKIDADAVMRSIRPMDADPYEPDADRLRREHEERWQRLIPKRFLGARLDDLSSDSEQGLLDWAKLAPVSGENLLILGPVGVGKTHAAIATLWACHDAGHRVMFVPIVEALDLLRPGGADDAVERMTNVRVLCLDDLGAERASAWTDERLYAIVNRRWMDKRPTIATSQLSPKELEDSVDPRLYSRLARGTSTLTLRGEDRRGK